ncbi:MAG: GNAT family N-acetyltransferase [Spirochaetia bacterium]|jgi:ribosomal protein S18 acetylase RimI-like enzyme
MNFELTPPMIDKIAFAMEDQKERFSVDVESGELVPVSSLGGASDERYVRLPRWGSAEGFHLMESFITSLDNPAYREQLSHSLTMGKGVFRAFKDALKQSKEIEKLWFAYKERRLRGVIISWYNLNREARGLAKLPAELEETEELVMSDFTFTWDIGGRAHAVLQLDRDAFFELFPRETPAELEKRFLEKRRELPAAGEAASPVLIAETPAGELAGLVWGVIDGRSVNIVQLAVSPGYRGTGLGEVLLRQFLTAMRNRGMQRLVTELMGKSLRFSDFFQSVGFVPVAQVMECSLDQLPY